MSNNVTSGMLAATPITVLGFTISDAVGIALLLLIAGAGLFIAGSSRWRRRSNDRDLGVTA